MTAHKTKSKPCKWTEDEDGNWDAECGGKFVLIDGLPSENNMNYCPYCGKSLKETRYFDAKE